jgi:TetR/AcrR family transcriptional repressor of nem operon
VSRVKPDRDKSRITRGESVAESGTADRILDVAERLVQSRGYNGFSYADVAAELGVTKASLHYHFPSKAELGAALISRYATRFAESLRAIDAQSWDGRAKLSAYAALYADVLNQQRMCLCGMLAADYETLPPAMRTAVVHFFDDNEAWLERVLVQGARESALHYPGRARDQAQLIIGALEGSMLVARPYGDPERLRAAAHRLIATLTGE